MIGSVAEVRERMERRLKARERRGRSAAIDASINGRRGCVPIYVPGAPMRCVACGSGAFHVGRTTAECGRCGMAMPLASD